MVMVVACWVLVEWCCMLAGRSGHGALSHHILINWFWPQVSLISLNVDASRVIIMIES